MDIKIIEEMRTWALAHNSIYLQNTDINVLINFLKKDTTLSPAAFKKQFKILSQRRLTGEPLAYITESINFWDNDFFIDKRVLKPRVETEQIITYIQSIASSLPEKEINIIDMGCGCGAIGISASNILKKANLILADVSPVALEVCSINASSLSQHKYQIICSDLWENIPKNKFDIIVANLPYLNSDIGWDQSTNFEPHIALEGGNKDGLSLYRRFIKDIHMYSHRGTHLIIESDRWQQPALEEILSDQGFTLQWQDYFISAFLATGN